MSVLGKPKVCARCGCSDRKLILFTCDRCHHQVCSNCFSNRYNESLCLTCRDFLIDSVSRNLIEKWGNSCPICGVNGMLAIDNIYFYHQDSPKMMYDYVMRCNACQNEINQATLGIVSEANRAERAGRYEDAARLLEKVNLLDRAKNLRERNRSSTVRNVNVDVNGLIEQLRVGGLSVPYKCQSCGATITIDSSTSNGAMKFCAYCGSAINTEILAALIKQALI